MEALRATPVEKIKDSVERHRPLEGVATIPPGMPDQSGHVYSYEEGADLMIEDGNYKRWPGVVSMPPFPRSVVGALTRAAISTGRLERQR